MGRHYQFYLCSNWNKGETLRTIKGRAVRQMYCPGRGPGVDKFSRLHGFKVGLEGSVYHPVWAACISFICC